MPLSKLQQALKAQQSQAAIAEAKKRSGQNKKAKEESLKHSAKEKRAMKRSRQAKRPMAEEASRQEANAQEVSEKDENMVVIPEGTLFAPSTATDSEEGGVTSKRQAKRAARKVNPNQLPIVPFDKTDTILLLGEANFSFALSLLSPSRAFPPHQLLATSYDTERECYLKYPDAEDNVKRLRDSGVKVEFKVDAGNLEKCKAVGKGRWSKVIFNFPHAGAGITDQDRNILSNQHLLLRTLRSVNPVLTHGPLVEPTAASSSQNKRKRKPSVDDSDEEEQEEDDVMSEVDNDQDDDLEDEEGAKRSKTATSTLLNPPKRQGSILITLLNQPPYTLWSLLQLAQRPPPSCPGTRLPQPRYTLLRSFKFHTDLYPGYAHRRTIGWKEGKSKSDNEEIVGRQGEARTWEFVRFIPKDKA